MISFRSLTHVIEVQGLDISPWHGALSTRCASRCGGGFAWTRVAGWSWCCWRGHSGGRVGGCDGKCIFVAVGEVASALPLGGAMMMMRWRRWVRVSIVFIRTTLPTALSVSRLSLAAAAEGGGVGFRVIGAVELCVGIAIHTSNLSRFLVSVSADIVVETPFPSFFLLLTLLLCLFLFGSTSASYAITCLLPALHPSTSQPTSRPSHSRSWNSLISHHLQIPSPNAQLHPTLVSSLTP